MPLTTPIAVSVGTQHKDRAQILAKQLSCPLCNAEPDSNLQDCGSFEFVLRYEDHPDSDIPVLALVDTKGKLGGSLFVDFVGGKLGHRRQFGGGRGQPLARAIGLKGGVNPTVVDATAGLGRDSFVLACLGAQVMLIERSPILGALLADGLGRASNNHEIASIVTERMNFISTDAIEWLTPLHAEQYPDVIYMDPMYPHRNKSALVKKEMRYLREIVGDDEDASQLLHIALTHAKKRVVVKRPRTATILSGSILNHRKPDTAIESKNTRYDIYLL